VTGIPGVDYAWSRPGGAALKAAGKKFACRYLSRDPSKNLTRAEADDLAAHGVSCVVVWETTARRPLDGRTAGATDATAAAVQAKAAGMPAGRPVYFAVDFDATEAQQPVIDAYLDGAASVLGRARVGIYGGYYPVKRALDAGKATWAWQTAAWSGGNRDPRAVIRQGGRTRINGADCDLNTATAPDYGQWRPGIPPTTEDTMTGMTAADINRAVWAMDNIAAPPDTPDARTNPTWQAQSYLKDTNARVRAIQTVVTAQTAAIKALAAQLGEDVDTDTVVAAVQKAIAGAVVHVDVDVTGPDAGPATATG